MKYLIEITKETREEDLHIVADNLESARFIINKLANLDDGFRVLGYNEGNGTLREGNKVQLRVYAEANSGELVMYDTIEEAKNIVNLLDGSDGYDLLDLEQPVGSAPTLIIESRPSLWRKFEGDLDGPYLIHKENSWGRTDNDRY